MEYHSKGVELKYSPIFGNLNIKENEKISKNHERDMQSANAAYYISNSF